MDIDWDNISDEAKKQLDNAIKEYQGQSKKDGLPLDKFTTSSDGTMDAPPHDVDR